MAPVISPWMIVSVIVAVVVGNNVAPWVALVSRDAARALKFGAIALGVAAGFSLLAPFLRGNLAIIQLTSMLPPLLIAGFWGAFAFAAWALVTSGGRKEGN